MSCSLILQEALWPSQRVLTWFCPALCSLPAGQFCQSTPLQSMSFRRDFWSPFHTSALCGYKTTCSVAYILSSGIATKTKYILHSMWFFFQLFFLFLGQFCSRITNILKSVFLFLAKTRWFSKTFINYKSKQQTMCIPDIITPMCFYQQKELLLSQLWDTGE